MIRVLVTGANGFIGRALCRRLLDAGFNVKGAVRSSAAAAGLPAEAEVAVVGDIDERTDWQEALAGVDVVVHLAARVHVMQETAQDPLTAFREVNVLGTERLARQAAAQGVRRLVFLSSIKVNGECTAIPFSADQPAAPQDAYGISKWQAEQILHDISETTHLQIVVIRPPLVYGPGVRGNFRRLLKLVERGLPLPFASIDNRRSLVNVDNLCDLLALCIEHPKAPGEVFLVSDNQDLATPELIRTMAGVLGRPARLLPFPVGWLHGLAGLLGRRQEMQRLTGSLQVDIGKTMVTLHWQPRHSLAQGIAKALRGSP